MTASEPESGLKQFFRNNGRYLKWRLRHPLSKWSTFYVDQVNARLDQDKPHPSLGTVHKDPDGFRRQGLQKLEFLKEQGLQPQHRIVDYGCGSLRLGMHLMDYLQPGGYWGLDITDRYFTDGVGLLDDAFVRDKQPNLRVINDASLSELEAAPPDFIVCSGVVPHIPRRELSEFFARIARMVGPQTQALIHFNESSQYEQLSRMSWSHPPEMLMDRARKCGLQARLLPRRPPGTTHSARAPEERHTSPVTSA